MSKIRIGVPPYWEEGKKHLCKVDKNMARIIHELEDPPLRSKGRIFETLAHAIVGQQISAKAADAIWKRLVQRLGAITPTKCSRVHTKTLRKVGLSARKVEYIKGLAKAGDFLESQPWNKLSDDAVRKTLCALKGIGPWTAEMVLIFTLLRPDILPLGDIGLMRALQEVYRLDAESTHADMEDITDKWRPYRTIGTWYMWRFLDAEPVEY